MSAVLTLDEAADEARVSVATIKRAIRATDPNAFPPPLQAKRQGRASNARQVILRPVFDAWLASWPDA